MKRRLIPAMLAGAVLTTGSGPRAAGADASVGDEVFRGQARFLALEAEQALEAFEPTKAVLLALNALPGAYGGDRPLVPAARTALYRAVHANRRIVRVEIAEDPLFAVVSPGGTRVAVVPEDADLIEVFEVATGDRLLCAVHEDVALHAAFSADERWLATLGDDGLRLWDLSDGSQTAHHEGRAREATAAIAGGIAPDQPLSAVLESLARQPVDLPQLGGAGSRDPQRPLVAFDPAATMVAFAAARGGLELRRVADGALLHRVDIDPKLLYFDDDGARVMVLEQDTAAFVALDVTTGVVEPLAEDLAVSRTLSGADGIRLGAIENGHLVLFDAAGERTAEIRTRSPWSDGDADSDPRGALQASTLIAAGPGLVAGGTSAGVLVWDPAKTTRLEHFRSGRISSLAVSPDGEYLVAGKFSGAVRLWDTEAFGSLWAEAERWALPSHDERVVFVGFAGDSTVSLAADRSLTFSKLPARKTELQDWGWDPEPAALLSRDGRWVGRYDDRLNTLDVWDTRTGEKRMSVDRTMQPLGRNSFHPDDARVLTSSPFSRILGEAQPAAEGLDLGSGGVRPATEGRPGAVDRSAYVLAGRRIVTAATGRKPSFSIWNAEGGGLLRHVEGERLLAASWLGSRLLTLAGRTLVVHDLADATAVTLATVPPGIDSERLAADFDHRGRRLLIRAGTALTLWDPEARAVVDSVSTASEASHFGLSEDGSRWFAVDDGILTLRQDGSTVDRIAVDGEHLLHALVGERLVSVTRGGSLLEAALATRITVEEAIAQLPVARSCLTPEERRAYDLPALSDAQWRQRGCARFASTARNRPDLRGRAGDETLDAAGAVSRAGPAS